MAPNSYQSTYQGDFGGRKSQSFSFSGGKQGPSLVARQSKNYAGIYNCKVRLDMTNDCHQVRAIPSPHPGQAPFTERLKPAPEVTASFLRQSGPTLMCITITGPRP